MPDVDLKNEKTYDLVFWTSIQKHTEFLIPLINEAFGEAYPKDAKVRLLPGKQAARKNDGSIDEGEMDALAEVIDAESDKDGRKYHFELQAGPDDTMAIRIAEYGAAYAYENVTWDGMRAEMTIPHAAVVFLRSNASTPDSFPITIHHPGGDADYEAPVLKLKNYSIDDIFRKNLLLLVPYFPFLLEGRMEEMNAAGYDFKDVQATLDDINGRLDELIAAGAIDETKKQHMLDWLKRVFDKLAAKYDNTRKGVDRIMKGYMLHTRTDDILDQGRREGRQIGNLQGRNERGKEVALRMSDDGLSIEKIAQYVGESVETVREWLSAPPVLA